MVTLLQYVTLTSKVIYLDHSFYGAATSTLQKVDQKHFESFDMWCWGWREKIIWIDRVRNGGVMEERNILSTSYLALKLPFIARY